MALPDKIAAERNPAPRHFPIGTPMKIARILIAALSLLITFNAYAADRRKPCEELRSEIAAKIEANGVRAYRIEIIDAAAPSDARTVGSCNGATQRVVYQKLVETQAIAVVSSTPVPR